MAPGWHGLPEESRTTFWRSLHTLNLTRIVIAAVLLSLSLGGIGRSGPSSRLEAAICLAYLLLAAGFAWLTLAARRRFLPQLMTQIGVDIGAISLLYLSAGGVRSGLAALYWFPLAGVAILAPLLLALFCGALVTLFMLAVGAWQAWRAHGQGDAMDAMVQTGLDGAALFAVVLLVGRLASRLIAQEALAARRGAALATQQAINRLVLDEMADGVLVTDGEGRPVAANPAARRLMGLAEARSGTPSAQGLDALPAWPALAGARRRWLAQPRDGVASITLPARDPVSVRDPALVPVRDLPPAPDSEPVPEPVAGTVGPAGADAASATATAAAARDVHLKLRFARVDPDGPAAGHSVVFLQDIGAIEQQAQQLKLAAMGRLTASIAHEVRNPLSAIVHAAALLGEDEGEDEAGGPARRRLLRIVADNAARIERMVGDILQLARKAQPEPLALAGFLAALKAEFDQVYGLAGDVLLLGDVGPLTLRFDPLHLREILFNLLGNAVRYASGAPGSIRLDARAGPDGRVALHVRDDGPAIAPEVRAHLFEPFHTTSSKGTGLGLYLARELCLNNGALLDYECRPGQGAQPHAQAGGRFVITLAAPSYLDPTTRKATP